MLSISGWGATGVQDTSTDKLQETEVPIVQSSNCIERMNQTEGVNEDLIVCAGGAGSGGPCKVNQKPKVSTVPNHHIYSRAIVVGHSQQQLRRVPTFSLGLSAKGLEGAAASRTMPSSPASLLSCHGLRLRSRRTEEWPPVDSTFLLHHP